MNSPHLSRTPRLTRVSGLLTLAVASWLAFAPRASAVSSPGNLLRFSQPDGTTFQARLVGDEHFGYYITADGQPMQYDPDTKWWHYLRPTADEQGEVTDRRVAVDAPPSAGWKPAVPPEEIEARKTRTYRKSVPTTSDRAGQRGKAGVPVNAKVAMLLTNFSDRTDKTLVTKESFETEFFDTSDPAKQTMANLYKQMSYGQHLVTSGPSGIADWVTAPKTHDYYGDGKPYADTRTSRENSAPVNELVRWRAANADATFDFGPYDTDNDGFVDLVCIVYQGTDQASSGTVGDIWPIRSALNNTTSTSDVGRIYVTNDTNAAGQTVKVRDFIVISERSSDLSITSVGLLCHEYGHGIGWPDLYDTEGSSAGVGDWCLMGGGNWNQKPGGKQGDSPAWANAWCRWQCGWIAPQNVTTNLQAYRLPDAKKENVAMRLWAGGADSSEYYLVENRPQNGFDQGLPGGGVLIWHIDETVTNNTQEWWSIPGTGGRTNQGHPKVALEQADGLFELERNLNNGNAGDTWAGSKSFTNTSVPSSKSYAGVVTNVAVRNVSTAASDGSVTADLVVNADQEFPEVLTMDPVDGQTYAVINSLSGTARDNVALAAVKVSIQLHLPSGDQWFNWTTSTWQSGTYSAAFEGSATLGGSGTTRTFNAGILAGLVTPASYSFFARAVDTSGAASAWRESRFQVVTDVNGPDVTFTIPSPAQNIASGSSVPNFQGTAIRTTGTIKELIALKMETGSAAGRFFDWTTNTFSAAGVYGAPNAYEDNRTTWVVNMAGRTLPVGTYTLFAKVINGDLRESDWRAQAFRVGLPVQVAVTTPQHNGAVTALHEIGGTVSEPTGTGAAGGGIRLTITDPQGRYWNGSAWVASSTSVYAPFSGTTWTYLNVPPGSLTPDGGYSIAANLTTNSGESSVAQTGVNQILFRVDGGPPTAAISSPTDGLVVTTNSLPAFNGTSNDPSGIGWVNCFIRRNRDGAYWSGSYWTVEYTGAPEDYPEGSAMGAPPVAFLTASFNAVSGAWSCISPLPVPGPSMENGSYNFIVMVGDKAGNYVQRDAAITVDFHQVYQWTAGSFSDLNPNNNNRLWTNAANWQPNGVPGAGDVALIDNGDSVECPDSITLYGLRLFNGFLNMTQGPGPNGTVTTTDASTWTDGGLAGKWVNQGTLTMSGAARKFLWDDAVIDNFGTISWNGGGPIMARSYTSGPSVINNKPGATFRVAGTESVFAREYGGPRASFRNETGARLECDVSGGAVATLSVWDFQNAGELRVSNGTLAFVDGAYDGYDLFLKPGTTLTGPGTLRLTNATQLMTAVHAQCTVEQVGDSWLGCLDPAGTDKIEGTYNWKGGFIYGDLTIGAAGVLNITDPAGGPATVKELWDSTTVHNDGTVNWLGAGPLRARRYTADPSVIDNRSGGTFNISAAGTVFDQEYGGPRPVFHNRAGAKLRKNGAGTATLTIWEWHNAGEINVAGGTLLFADGARDGYDLFLEAGTTLTGTGTLRLNNATQLQTAVRAQCPVILVPDSWLGCLDAAGTDVIEGDWTWQGGVVQGNLTVGPLGVLTLSDADPQAPVTKQLWDDTVLNNLGTIVWKGGGPLQTRSYTGGPATVNNRSGAVFRVEADGSVLAREYGGPTGTFFNEVGARFVRSAGNGSAFVHSLDFVNNGELEAATGVLSFNTALRLGTGTLKGAGRFEMSGGRVNVSGQSTLTGTTFSVLAGDIVGESGSWLTSNAGAWRWLGGIFSGQMEIGPGSRLEIADPPASATEKLLWDDAVLVNRGTIAWSGAGPLRGRGYTSGPSFIRQKSGALFSVETDTAVMDRQYGGPIATFVNEAGATISKQAGNAAVPVVCDWRLENAGSVIVNGGGLDFQRGGDSTGAFTGNATGVVRFTGGSHVLRNNAALGGTGAVRIAGGEVVGDGNIVLSLASGAVFELLSGSLVGTSNCTGSGVFHWKGGVIAGALTLGPGLDTRVSGADLKEVWDSSTITNQGLMTWLGASPIVAHGYTGGPSVIVNASGATFRLAGTGAAFGREYGGPRPVFQNLAGALFERAAMAGETSVSVWEIHNAGQIKVGAGGRLAFVDGPFDGYDVFLEPGTSLTGTGELRLQTATSLTAAITATCPVELPDSSWFAGLEPAGNARFTGPLKWTGGVIAGTVTFGAGSSVTVQDATAGANVPKVLWDEAVINNDGAWTWTGGGTIRARSYTGGPARFNNRAGGSLSLAATGVFANREYAGPVPEFQNAGSVVLTTTRGARSMNGWSFSQTATGALSLTLAGTGATAFDSFGTDFGATLGGTVTANLGGGFTPAVGNAFRVVNCGSVGGTFASVSTPGAFFTRAYDGTGLTLTTTNAPVDLADWKSFFFGNDAVAGADLADPDGDGLPNLIEYALSLNPKTGSTGGLPSPQRTVDSKLSLTFSRRLNNDVVYQVEGSDDQKTWSMLALLPAGASQWSGPGTVTEVSAGATCTCTVIDTAIIGVRKNRFLRLRASKP